MRIALVYDGVYPHSVGGGEKLFHDLARYLGARHEVVVLGMHLWEGPAEQQIAPGVRLVGICRPESGITLQAGSARSLKQALRFSAATFRALKEHGPFDLVDCMATPYFPLYAAWLRCRLNGTPLVSTWLELWRLADWRGYMGPGPGAWLAWGVEHFATKLPRHIISISPQTTAGLASRGIADPKVTTITPWADLDAIQDVAPDDCPSDVLFAGRLIRSKGVDLLIDAFAVLHRDRPGLRCRIIGDGPERSALEARVRGLGLDDAVVFEGFLSSHGAVIAAMKSSRIFVLPSTREGFGIVVVEAAACGVPTVTVELPNNASRHLVRECGVGAVCAAEADALAMGMGAALDHLGEAEQARCVAWARGYDWNSRAVAYERIYLQHGARRGVQP